MPTVPDAYGFGPHGIEHDIPTDLQKMAVFLNQDPLKTALK
jgi:hypothetical protein